MDKSSAKFIKGVCTKDGNAQKLTYAGLKELLNIIVKNNLTYFNPQDINQEALEHFFWLNASAWRTEHSHDNNVSMGYL